MVRRVPRGLQEPLARKVPQVEMGRVVLMEQLAQLGKKVPQVGLARVDSMGLQEPLEEEELVPLEAKD